jgi:hypothetical protein
MTTENRTDISLVLFIESGVGLLEGGIWSEFTEEQKLNATSIFLSRESRDSADPPYTVFIQNTPRLSDAVPMVGTLGWYALPL